MQRAGLALAKLSLAVAPHAHVFWIACGRGNNGGDGLEAAFHLHQWGKEIHVSMPAADKPLRTDAGLALARAGQAGLAIHDHAPDHWDACIDALLGIGLTNAPTGTYAGWIGLINSRSCDVISADIPSGLMADTGDAPGACVAATHTLSMLSLKPGLLTFQGRDACGSVWLNTLGVDASTESTAWLNPLPVLHQRPHLSHKGSFGDVAVAGRDAGHARRRCIGGSGGIAVRCWQGLLGFAAFCTRKHFGRRTRGHHAATCRRTAATTVDTGRRLWRWRRNCTHSSTLAHGIKALGFGRRRAQCHCGVRRPPKTASGSRRRFHSDHPSPLEAARLLGCSVGEVQADRLRSAQLLANQFKCTVILKGSGSIIAAPDRVPHINPSGNGKLAIAGTGDVLAGMTGAALARHASAWKAACDSLLPPRCASGHSG